MKFLPDKIAYLQRKASDNCWDCICTQTQISIKIISADDDIILTPISLHATKVTLPTLEMWELLEKVYSLSDNTTSNIDRLSFLLETENIDIFLEILNSFDDQKTSQMIQEYPLTDKEDLITDKTISCKVRRYQSWLRKVMLKQWGHQCAVTNIPFDEILITSHIKPWNDYRTSPKEKVDPDNVLPLIPTLDALFGKGYISFSSNGHILISSLLNTTQKKKLSLDKLHITKPLNKKQQLYLEWHRHYLFKK